MKKIFGFFAAFIFLAGIVCGTGFLALNEYYQDKFPVNTWINSIYCTGKTVSEINEELINIHEASVIQVADADCTYWEIDMEEANIRPDYTEQLEAYLKKCAGERADFALDGFKEISDIKLEIQQYVYEEEKLKACFFQLPFVQQELEKKAGVEILVTEEDSSVKYSLWDGNAGRLNTEKAFAVLLEALKAGKRSVSLAEEGCYEDLPDSTSDTTQRELWEKINQYADSRLVYDMGAELIEITPEMMLGFLEKEPETKLPLFDEKGQFVISEQAVNQWVDALSAQYNTANTERDFQSTRGDVVKVKYTKYGTKLDGNAEKAYLLKALQEVRSETEYHVPTYLMEGYVRGRDDIGGTYVEIDLTNQKMYYYENGALLLETSVVTGDLSMGWDTPQGICYVYGKSRKVVLKGPGYESFVEYWMPVWGGVGIHDASWRNKFGGEIYKKNGSHGCINTPPEIMDAFYEAIQLGTPVIMFH